MGRLQQTTFGSNSDAVEDKVRGRRRAGHSRGVGWRDACALGPVPPVLNRIAVRGDGAPWVLRRPRACERTQVLQAQLATLSFMHAGHIGVPAHLMGSSAWLDALRSLNLMAAFSSPEDKMACA